MSITLNVLLQPHHPQVRLLDGHTALAILALCLALLQARSTCRWMSKLRVLAAHLQQPTFSETHPCEGSAGFEMLSGKAG